MQISAITTAMLAVTRFLKLRFPFLHVSKTRVRIYLGVMISAHLVYFLVRFSLHATWCTCFLGFVRDSVYDPEQAPYYLGVEFAENTVVYLHVVCAVVSCMLTVVHLRGTGTQVADCGAQQEQRRARVRRSITTVRWLSAGVSVQLLLTLALLIALQTDALRWENCRLLFVQKCVVPAAMSAYNPLTVLLCNRNILRRIRGSSHSDTQTTC